MNKPIIIDGEILDHEGIYCDRFEEYKENEIEAYKQTLNEIETSLKGIHYPLCEMEKYVFDYDTDEVDEQVQNIHKGYMQILNAINKLREIKGIK